MQYASHEYVDYLKAAGLRISMSNEKRFFVSKQWGRSIRTLKPLAKKLLVIEFKL
jgi:hypothetical protein